MPTVIPEFAKCDVVGGGSLVGAAFLAIYAQPSNPNCIDLLENGLKRCML